MNPLQRELQNHLSTLTSGPEGEFNARFALPSSFSGFQGHFPDNPVLPGVCMVQAVVAMQTALRGAPVTLRRIVSAKWFKPVKPETELHFACREKRDAMGDTTIRARITAGGETMADLVIVVTDANSAGGTL